MLPNCRVGSDIPDFQPNFSTQPAPEQALKSNGYMTYCKSSQQRSPEKYKVLLSRPPLLLGHLLLLFCPGAAEQPGHHPSSLIQTLRCFKEVPTKDGFSEKRALEYSAETFSTPSTSLNCHLPHTWSSENASAGGKIPQRRMPVKRGHRR